jgi:hypothetical protein
MAFFTAMNLAPNTEVSTSGHRLENQITMVLNLETRRLSNQLIASMVRVNAQTDF